LVVSSLVAIGKFNTITEDFYINPLLKQVNSVDS
jgi:hypothetical protein